MLALEMENPKAEEIKFGRKDDEIDQAVCFGLLVASYVIDGTYP